MPNILNPVFQGVRPMASVAIEEQVKQIICEKLSVKPEQITPATSFINDLGADSLDTVELVMEFEDKFGMQIPDEEAEKLLTVGDALKYIEDRVPKA
jgi:acyl carrier protein